MNAVSKNKADVIIVGSGLAGLACALSLAPRPVTIITKTISLAGGSSWWAQGGIAAAIGPGDSPVLHAADTLAAGGGLSDPVSVRDLTGEASQGVQWLLDQGIQLDRTSSGTLSLSREAAHQSARVVHAGGDATGKVVMEGIIQRVLDTPSIRVITDTFVDELICDDNGVRGVVAFSNQLGRHCQSARHVVLATGGIGSLWSHTTNPVEATGDGLAMAARAGAKLADLEFVQFHPTALDGDSTDGQTSLPLLTEALRGAGATLLDESGIRFMLDEHESAELAPRDVVSRAIYRRVRNGGRVFLDLRPILTAGNGYAFPHAMAIAGQNGFDPATEALPVTPAAHYHMGGVATDRDGRSSVAGLWACGEAAATGVHGANRLASNSLLEALAYSRRVAYAIKAEESISRPSAEAVHWHQPKLPQIAAESLRAIADAARTVMSQQVGILRSGPRLKSAHKKLSQLQGEFDALVPDGGSNKQGDFLLHRHWGETRNQLLVARLVTLAALRREDSRGAHFRDDFPLPRARWCHRQALTIEALVESH